VKHHLVFSSSVHETIWAFEAQLCRISRCQGSCVNHFGLQDELWSIEASHDRQPYLIFKHHAAVAQFVSGSLISSPWYVPASFLYFMLLLNATVGWLVMVRRRNRFRISAPYLGLSSNRPSRPYPSLHHNAFLQHLVYGPLLVVWTKQARFPWFWPAFISLGCVGWAESLLWVIKIWH